MKRGISQLLVKVPAGCLLLLAMIALPAMAQPVVAPLRPTVDAPDSSQTYILNKDYDELRRRAGRVKAEEIAALEQKATTGDLSSQLLMGMLYQLGCGTISRDPAKALAWYHKAADQESPQALNQMGAHYDTGPGKDAAEGFKWYRRAADHDDAVAEYNVGSMYEQGAGVPQDGEKAAIWYRRAVEHGVATPLMRLLELYDKGKALTSKSLADNQAEGEVWLRARSDKGDPAAQLALAKAYRLGLLGLPRDEAQSMVWLRKAAEKDAEAQADMGWAYSHGQNVAKNEVEAVAWYREAAEQGDRQGQSNLAFMYENGKGVHKDLSEAAKWYQAAAEKGDAPARYALARMYEDGRGVTKDRIAAMMWFLLAEDTGGPNFMKELHPNTTYGGFAFYRHPSKAEFDEAMKRAYAWRDRNYCR